MNVRAVCEGHFTLPLEPEAAVQLFTPEGERRWAGGTWDPVYPVIVQYDVTSLETEGAACVRELEAGFDEFMNGWRDEIIAGAVR